MKSLKTFCVIIMLFNALIINAQDRQNDWGWDWAKFVDVENVYTYGDFKTDFNNNFFSYYFYNDSIILEDTSFNQIRPIPNYSHNNLALVKRNAKGEFIKAIDVYAGRYDMLYNIDMEIDKEDNIYLYGSFWDTLHINGNLITCPSYSSNIFLIKLDNDLNFLWAKTIFCPIQDQPGGLAISDDNFIYISAEVVTSIDTSMYVVNYLDQDSAFVLAGLTSVMKLDKDGNLLWRREIRETYDGSYWIDNTIVGKDGFIYATGRSTDNIIVEGDTIFRPGSPDNRYLSYIVKFDETGGHLRSGFLETNNFSLSSWDLAVDDYGNYYCSGLFFDTTVILSDTILISDDSIGLGLIKMDPELNPLWYEYNLYKSSATFNYKMNLIGDSIVFAVYSKKTFSQGGIEFPIWNGSGILFAVYSPEGIMDSYQFTPSTREIQMGIFGTDNCGNFYTEGKFSGLAYFGEDTLDAWYYTYYYMAKNARVVPAGLNMPADTSGCNSLVLQAPEGYAYYKWNGDLSANSLYEVTESGEVELSVANEEGCWSEARTYVTLYMASVYLGPDTTILLTDSLKLFGGPDYESYLWSTGDTTPYLLLPAQELQIGINQIWLSVTRGACTVADTMNVLVIDNSGISELSSLEIYVFPNPASEKVHFKIANNSLPKSVNIYDLAGMNLFSGKLEKDALDVSGLKAGIYILEFVFDEGNAWKKLVIN